MFDDDLLHCSGTNDSSRTRVAIQLRFIPKGAPFLHYHFDPTLPGLFEVYESNADYYIRHFIGAYQNRPIGLKLVDMISNKNRMVTVDEFTARLESERERRAAIYKQVSSELGIV